MVVKPTAAVFGNESRGQGLGANSATPLGFPGPAQPLGISLLPKTITGLTSSWRETQRQKLLIISIWHLLRGGVSSVSGNRLPSSSLHVRTTLLGPGSVVTSYTRGCPSITISFLHPGPTWPRAAPRSVAEGRRVQLPWAECHPSPNPAAVVKLGKL